jgi:hypothetical protein
LFAPGGAGETNAPRLARLFGNRQPSEDFLDQIRMPISLSIFEPFCAIMRPNVLRPKQQAEAERPKRN